MLGHRADTAEHLETALAADPELAAAQLLRGFALRVLGRRDLLPGIRSIRDSVKRTFESRGYEARELALFQSLSAWIEGRGREAADVLDDHLRREPRDLLAIKLSHAVRFILGDLSGMRSSVDAVLPAFDEECPGLGFVMGCSAFVHEEGREFSRAESAARRGLELEPRDVWGLHALVHVYYELGHHRFGATWLAEREPLFEGVNNFAGHLAWHEALFHVESGRPASAIDLYDRRIAVYSPRDYRDFSNASSLLVLLEGNGFDLKQRWSALASIARERIGDHGSAFADLHYVLALAGHGRLEEASRFVASMRRSATPRLPDEDARVQVEVGIPLAEAVIESRAGRNARAKEILERHRDEAVRIGGSRAQRRVLDWVLAAGVLDPAARSEESSREQDA